MNYYPFHMGDYSAHTAHLSWEEDLIYRRLLDLYYLHEKAVPADVQRLARLIRMPKQTAAIESVLQEFFELGDDGWHNKRADEELARLNEKSEASEERDENEKARMKRYRERRAAMFQALRDVGVVPAWDVAMPELQRLFNENCNAPATHLQRNSNVTGNADATAIPKPITKSITEPNGSGGNPPAIPAELSKEELWRYAVALLGGQGVAEKQARSLIGKLSKAYSDVGGDIVATAVREAVTHQPANASEYLVATCQRLAGERGRNGQKLHDWTENAK